MNSTPAPALAPTLAPAFAPAPALARALSPARRAADHAQALTPTPTTTPRRPGRRATPGVGPHAAMPAGSTARAPDACSLGLRRGIAVALKGREMGGDYNRLFAISAGPPARGRLAALGPIGSANTGSLCISRKRGRARAREMFHIAAMVLGLSMAHAAVTAGTAVAEQRRVVVLEFEGSRPEAKRARRVVIEVLADFYEILSYSKYRIAKRRLNIHKMNMKRAARVARKIGADAIIRGAVDGERLKLQVREGSTGRLIDRIAIRLGRAGLSERGREELTDELVDFIDSTEPIGSLDPRGDEPEGDEAPKASLASAAGAGGPRWAIDTVTKLEAEEKKESEPSPVRLSATIGASGTIRSLQFAFSPDLADDERPLQQSGTPAMSVALGGSLEILPLGITGELTYERSVGAALSFPDGNTTRELPIASSHLAGRLIAARDVGPRYGLVANVGYGQLSYSVKNKPNGLLLPDSRYAYLFIGGGARVRFRDDRVALIGGVDYVHVISAGGITAAAAYGTASARGVRGHAGLEIKASETTYVRIGVRATQITLAFHGNGALATDLDESSDVDVSGASDTYVGGAGAVGFHF